MTARRKDALASRDRNAAASSREPVARRRSRRTVVGTIVVLALIALLAAAASRRGIGNAPTTIVRVAPGDGRVGSPMTSFRLRDVTGAEVSVPTEGIPGVVMFSASSCTSCIPSMRALVTVKIRYGARLDATMVSIERGDTVKYLREWAALIGRVPFPLTIDTTQQLATAFKIEYMGVMVIYNAHGQIVNRLDDPDLKTLESTVHKAGEA